MTGKRNVALLAACQGLLLTNGVTVVAVTGLATLALVGDARLATVPLTSYVIGGALTTLPAAFFMKRFGRRAGFMLGALLGMIGPLLAAAALVWRSFPLLCLGTALSGAYNAFGQQYRFAAADAVEPDWKGRAISLTLAGGIIGGVIGPESGKLTRDLLQPAFLASYITLAGFAFLALLISSRLAIPPLAVTQQHSGGRSLGAILRQPAALVAVLAAACGYGVMNLLMTATPLAMDLCSHPFNDAAFVIEWHVIGMFAPSFVTGHLLKRFGIPRMLLVGAALMLACIAIALSGTSVMHFWAALILLGIGWNFLFLGGTTLLTETYRPEERAKVQGSNDFIIFTVQGITSLSSGLLVNSQGWETLNWLALPGVLVTALATSLWLARCRPAPSPARPDDGC
ncbi:MAG: MFS transporter [Rhodocyclaceae bacterium]|nr:MFS transporter [Rhodocyclaceae bacterium]